MRGEGAIMMACLRRGSGHRSAQEIPRPPDVHSGGHASALWRGLAPYARQKIHTGPQSPAGTSTKQVLYIMEGMHKRSPAVAT